VTHPGRAAPHFDPTRRWGEPPEKGFVRLVQRTIDDGQGVGQAQSRGELPKGSPWNHPAVPKTRIPVEAEQIQVPRQPVVMESIVEPHHVAVRSH
jgi:hypothetical protein